MTDIATIAAAFKCAKTEFEKLFDEMSEIHNGLPFKLIALGTNNNGAAFEKAMKHADENGWLSAFSFAAVKAGLLDTGDGNDADNNQVRVELQSLINPHAGFIDAKIMSRGGLAAYSRVCTVLVDNGNNGQGTGFLTGPQTILTAWHVIRELVGDNGDGLPGTHERLTVKFDAPILGGTEPVAFGVVENWLLASSLCEDHEIPDAQGAVASNAPTNSDRLDFALVRLDGLPGRLRRYYTISERRWPKADKKIFVFQHPHNSIQRVDVATTFRYNDETSKLRIIHNANTLPGSSGGLCLNEEFEPVALHQCGLRDGNDQPIGNGAIPTAHIATHLKDAATVDVRSEALVSLPNDRHPVIGRRSFQTTIWDVADGVKRILRIRGGENSGKSFSTRILKALLPMDQHLFIEIPAAEIPARDIDLARAILEQLGKPGGDDFGLPAVDTSFTSDSAWRVDELFPAFRSRFEQLADQRLVWLIIDDLEHHDLADAGGRRFLELLYKSIRVVPSLRIVLIGLKGKIPGADPSEVMDERISPMEQEEISEFLGQCYSASDLDWNGEELGRMSKIIQRVAADSEEDETPAVANFVSNVVVPSLDLLRDE